MGYRHRFASVPITTVADVRDMSVDELKQYMAAHDFHGYDAEENYFAIYNLLGQKEFYDFGKDCPFAATLIKMSQPLFKNPHTQEVTEGIVIVDEDGFKLVIEEIRKIILKTYTDCLEDFDHQGKAWLYSRAQEWSLMSDLIGIDLLPEQKAKANELYLPYSLDRETDTIVQSWLYEYSIFELVRLYKTFDWKNNTILFYGW